MSGVLIFPGRFQPPHRGHVQAILAGLGFADRVIVVCGGVDLSPSIQRPWSYAERADLLSAMLPEEIRSRVRILAVPDNPYRPARWADSIRSSIAAEIDRGSADAAHIGMLAGTPAEAQFLDGLFPDWTCRLTGRLEQCESHELRAQFLANGEAPTDGFTEPAAVLLRAWQNSGTYRVLRTEFEANERFRARWSEAPWPPVFVTVDAVVVTCEALLLIRRGRFPGKGLWALPGGFLDPDESLYHACLRELAEETAIDVDSGVLAAGYRGVEVFDQPERSARGRTITHAFHFVPEVVSAPRVSAGDDAAEARWTPLREIRRQDMFEDHYAILQAVLGVE